MRSFAVATLLPFLLASVAASTAPVVEAVSAAARDSTMTPPLATGFSDLSFNASSTTRAPRATMTPAGRMTKKRRYYWGPSIIQDPEPGDESVSQPPIGGGHSTPDASQGLTPPSFPPRPAPSSSSSPVSSADPAPSPSSSPDSSSSTPSEDASPSPAPSSESAPTSSSTQDSGPSETDEASTSSAEATSAHHDSRIAENRARRQKAWTSYTSKLGELSRLSALAAKTKTAETPKWTKIRDYRDKIFGENAGSHKVRKTSH
ncbi:hypothetical protein JCM3766R1_007024 [Sporobolomyces carnicolor]